MAEPRKASRRSFWLSTKGPSTRHGDLRQQLRRQCLELLKGVAGIGPDIFFGICGPDLPDQIQHSGLVFRLKGLSSQQGQTLNIRWL